ncbi:MAG: hypothetical protein JWQ43_283, partial [Glaciihabitans sp.]|nr:hypothetical protein [Glaciihabitans sp.]
GTDPAVVDAARQIVTTGDATITAKDPLAAGVEAARIVESAGGRVDGRTEEAPIDGNAGRATLQLRIPADSLTTTLESLKDLGEVVSVNMSSSDVTTASADLDARITALSASVDRLLGLLTTATDTSTLIDLETAISGRQGELESLQAQRRLLSDQVAMSSVNLNLVSVADAPRDEPDNFWDALLAGLASFAAFFAGLLLVLGFLIPWIAVVALGVLVALLVTRRRKKRAASDEASRAATSPLPAPNAEAPNVD